MAAIVDFEKVAEDDDAVTYRYGTGCRFDHSFRIGKANRGPRMDESDFTGIAPLALSGILRSYRERGTRPSVGPG